MNNTLSNRSMKILLPIALLVLVSLACAVAFPQTTPVPTPTQVGVQIQATMVPITLPVQVLDEQSLLVSLYARVNPSVVNITIYAKQLDNSIVPLGFASGFVYDDQKHIVTNAHVVQNADEIEITFSDGTVSAATQVGIDYNSDLAVLLVDRIPAGVLPLPLGDMSTLAVGQTVIAVGNPFGELEGTLTKGVISALGRQIPALTQFRIPQSIQTDAAINPGNSGGPLLNLQGEVIGVNAMIETSNQSGTNSGIGFAIPVSVVKRAIPDLVAKGKTEWSWLGVTGGDLTPTIAKAMNLNFDRGAYLSQITPDGPASQAGLHGSSGTQTVDGRTVEVGGDIITAIDGQPVRSFNDLLVYIALQSRPGQKVTLTIARGGNTMDIAITLGVRPEVVNTNPGQPLPTPGVPPS